MHNDLHDNSGRVRCRELLTRNLRNFGREQHYTEAEADAKMAARYADDAEADASEAIDYATWAADNARIAVLDALDARQYADELAASTKH